MARTIWSRVWEGTNLRRFGIGFGDSLGRFRANAPRLRCVGVFPLEGVILPRSKATRPVPNGGVSGARKHSSRIHNITFHIGLMFFPKHGNCVVTPNEKPTANMEKRR